MRLYLPPEFPAGQYSVTLSVAPTKTSGLREDPTRLFSHSPLPLGVITMISSKREVLRDALVADQVDWLLVAKVLVSL